MNLQVTSVLTREFSDKAGGKQIGGFMATALANPKGELVIPALVAGTTDKPKFLPDAAQIAKMKMQSLLPSTGNPGALATGVAGAIQGKKEGVKGILDALTAKPQESEQKPADQGSGQSRSICSSGRRRTKNRSHEEPGQSLAFLPSSRTC